MPEDLFAVFPNSFTKAVNCPADGRATFAENVCDFRLLHALDEIKAVQRLLVLRKGGNVITNTLCATGGLLWLGD